MKKYKIIFMGTTDFGQPTLKQLLADGHNIQAVFCQPDRPNKRGKKITYLPIKKLALEAELNVCQPEKVNQAEWVDKIRSFEPDFLIVAAYGQKLSKEILDIPRYGAINIHGSLLPKYRGAAPIQRAIIDGEQKTGVTIMEMGVGMDTGDMLLKAEAPITETTTFGSLHESLALAGAKLLCDNLQKIAEKEIIAEKQDDALATYAQKIEKETGHIDWNQNGQAIVSLINGMDPAPGAFFLMDEQKVKCFSPVFEAEKSGKNPGQVLEADHKKGLFIAVNNGKIRLDEIQAPGKKRMDTKVFLRGNTIEIGSLFK